MNVVVDFVVNRKDERCGAFYKFYLSPLFFFEDISLVFSDWFVCDSANPTPFLFSI